MEPSRSRDGRGFVNNNDPEIGKDAVAMLEKAGCAVDCPEQVCCGMPKLDGGDLEGARKLAAQNVETLLPHVRAGKKVLSPGPSCTLVLRTEYPELVPTPEAREVAAAVMDLTDFLLQQARARKLPKPPEGAVGKVAFHVACHNRVQNFGYRGRDLLKWAGGEVTLVDRCCGMDGTWGMKSEFFEESLKVAEGAARKVEAAEPDTVSSDCPLAGLQLRQKTGRRSYHPVRILRAAYDEPLRSPKKPTPSRLARMVQLRRRRGAAAVLPAAVRTSTPLAASPRSSPSRMTPGDWPPTSSTGSLEHSPRHRR